MKDHYRIVIVADTHIGAERRPWLRKLGVTAEQYDRPFNEAFEWADNNDADLTIVAGDLYHSRSPLPNDYRRTKTILNWVRNRLIIAGNHDIGMAGDIDALWSEVTVARGKPSVFTFASPTNAMQVLTLPWPRPTDYTHGPHVQTIEEEIESTRRNTLQHLEAIAQNDLNPDRPAILVGHAMVAYGNTTPDDPGLLLGKDVVLPYESLTSLPNIGGVYLGHVHDPSSPAYVGSTQPTDWSEGDQVKSFTVVNIWSHGDAWVYEARQIPYATSLKLATVSNDDYELAGDYDGVRLTWTVREGDDPEQLAIAERALRDQQSYVEVIVEHEVKRAARVETIEPLAKMSPMDALGVWLEQRETPSGDRKAVETMAHEVIRETAFYDG